MTNSRARGGWITIENYVSPSTAATKTFTFASDDFSTTSKYVLIIDGNITAALALELKLNGETSGHYAQGRSITAGAETLINESAAAHATLLTAAILANTQRPFHIEISIYGTSTATTDHISFRATSTVTQAESETEIGGWVAEDTNALDSIVIETSTSTWIANTRMTLYRVPR